MTKILTLRLDIRSQQHFDAMRREHYPAHLNRISAHLTLFHSLPDEDRIVASLAAEAAKLNPFAMQVTGLRSLGRGVAYRLTSSELLTLHANLSRIFMDDLTAQDRQRFQPHVVIQNKSTSEQARELLSRLQAQFTPFPVQAEGLDLWHYLGGPWEHASFSPFAHATE